MVVFAPQNLIMDPPFTKLDLLCCRNLLIYFNAELQKKLLPLFHYTLNPGGIRLPRIVRRIVGGFQDPSFVVPSYRRNEVLGFLKKNNELEDLCISRPAARLNWGIPIPFDADYVTYVWVHALVNYISVPAERGDARSHAKPSSARNFPLAGIQTSTCGRRTFM